MKNAQGEEFSYTTLKALLSAEEIEGFFKIPEKIAAEYPLQIIHLKNFYGLENLKMENVTGISVYAISPEEITHQFFKNKNNAFVEEKNYKARFANFSYCSFYQNIFEI